MKNYISLKKLIENESFVLCPFVTTDKFISYCKERGIQTSKGQLEQFEKLGIFFPVARVKFPKIKIKIEIDRERNQQKHFGVLQEGEEWDGDIEKKYAGFGWTKNYAESWFKEGHLWDPSSTEFQEWKSFRDNDGDLQIESYYSIFQCYTLYNLKKATEIPAHVEDWFSYEDEELNRVAKQTSERAKGRINTLKESGVRGEKAPLLCQALSNRFFPETQTDQRTISSYMPSISFPGFYEGWKWDWDDYCDSWDAKAFLKALDFTIEDIKDIHERLSIDAQWMDPLEHWYALVSFVALDHKKKLKGDALLAQTIYSMEHMVRLFYKALTSEKLFAPNESYNWHPDKYHGEGVSANKLQYLEFLTNQYHLNPRPKLILVVEGHGEEEQFPRLSQELLGRSFLNLGIEIINLQGVGGFTGKKNTDKYGALEKFIDYYHDRQTIVFVILDDEGHANTVRTNLITAHSKYNKDRMVTKPEYIHLWEKKTVEFENFSHSEIAQALSEMSEGKPTFASNEIGECYDQLKIRKSDPISKLFQEKTGTGLKKPAFLGILFGYIIKNAENEFDEKKVPVRSVSKVLQRVIQLTVSNNQPASYGSWERNQKTGYFGDIKQ